MAERFGLTLEKLGKLLRQEEEILKGARSSTEEIKNELERIKSSVEDAKTGEEKESLRAMARELKEIIYDVEDVLDELVLFTPRSHGSGCSVLSRWVRVAKNLHARNRISMQIQVARSRLRTITSRRNLYMANSIEKEEPANATRNRLHGHRVDPHIIPDAELVGIHEPKQRLLEWLTEKGSKNESKLKVITVVGTGGLGKTTLVKKVYDDEVVKGHFQCHAWLTVSASFSTKELLISMIVQVFEERNEPIPESIGMMGEYMLTEMSRRYLHDKSYVVVFDDVWHADIWDSFKFALPENSCGSRILVTTRIGDAYSAFESSSRYIYNIQPLLQEEAWSLFCKKAFQSIPGAACPPELVTISEDIVQMCAGSPLAIVAIGGLLSRKEKVAPEWNKLRDQLRWELGRNSELDVVRKLLLLSYNDLPYSLKPCFLYFSIFPKNYSIKSITLVRLWMAEGFVEDESGRTPEEVAEDYLNELIERSMVQVAEFYDYGRVRSCRVHNITREIIVLKSEEENFSTSLSRKNKQMGATIRRLSIHNTSDDVLANTSFPHLRALFMFGPNAIGVSFICTFVSRIRLLRILDLEGAPIKIFPVEFVNLLHLRYLSLRNTRIDKIPKSLGKLEGLETLDLKGTRVSELPLTILKLASLRHLLVYQYYQPYHYTHGVKVPPGIRRLTELQKLSYIEANQNTEILEELQYLTQLKRLGIVKLRRQDGVRLCSSIEKMTKLLSLSVTSIHVDEILDLESLSTPPPLLQRLYLRGTLGAFPQWVSSLEHLVRMRLKWSRLAEDSLRALQYLPNLVELTLIQAYDGEELCCEEGGFQRLRTLDLEKLANLECVRVAGAMQNLQKLYIRSCERLESVPEGIEQLRNLKELHLFGMPEAFMHRLRRQGGEDRPKVEHIPTIHCYNYEDKNYEVL